MTEAQKILIWVQSVGISDREIAAHLGVSRETIVRVRSAKNRCNGATFLDDLRAIARENMPGYTTTPIPRVHKSPVTPTVPTTVKAPIPHKAKSARSYAKGTQFYCPHCHFKNTARASNSYCVNCETPYVCR